MSFLSPWVLAGLAAVGIPVLIHLLNKLRVKSTDWGAMKLLLDSVKQEERKVKLDDLILLLLRCALVALAVIAFARPVLKGTAKDGEAGGPVAAVILLDNSASMGRSAGASTCFELAKQDIRTWLDGVHQRSEVGLILASDTPVPLVVQPVDDPVLLRNALDQASVSDKGSELMHSLGMAIDALAGANDRPKEIRIYTDGQRSLLRDPESLRRLAREHPEIVIRPILVGGAREANLGIVLLEAGGGIPAPGRPVKIHAKVLNSSAAEALDVPLEFTLDDGTPAGSLSIPRIGPGATAEAVLSFPFAEAGPQALTATLPPDALAVDNRRSLALDVARRKDVLVVNPASVTAGFVAKAIAPVPQGEAGKFFLAPLMAEAAELPALLAKDERPFAVVLCEAGTLPPATVKLLDGYVSMGGNLLVLPKERAEAWSLGGLLPASLADEAGGDASGGALTWQGRELTHPVTRYWSDPANGTLGSVTLARHFPMKLQAGEVVVALSDGSPAVVLGKHGAGSVVLFAAPLDPEWTNLPLHPAFVPFFQRLLGELDRGGQGSLNLRPGEIFRKTLPPEETGKNFTLRLPAPQGEHSGGVLEEITEGAVIRVEDTWRQGVYRATVDGEPAAVFTVGLDPEESRLEPIPAEDFAAWTTVVREASADSSRTVVLKDFLPLLLWSLAGLALVECFMAYRVTMAR